MVHDDSSSRTATIVVRPKLLHSMGATQKSQWTELLTQTDSTYIKITMSSLEDTSLSSEEQKATAPL
jgi:hypothetical protein